MVFATVLLAPIIPIGGTISCNFTCPVSIPAGAVMHSAGQNLLGWRMYESISVKLFGYGGFYGTFYYFGALDSFMFLGYGVLLYLILPLSLAAVLAFWAGFRKTGNSEISNQRKKTVAAASHVSG